MHALDAASDFRERHGDIQLEAVLVFAGKVLAERPQTDWDELAEVVTVLFPRFLLPHSRQEREWFFTALGHGVVANLVITVDPKARAREQWTMKTLAGAPLDTSHIQPHAAA